MGIVNLYKGLNSEREIYNFTGKLKDYLDLNWDYTEIYKSSEKLTPEYEVQEDDVLIIQEYPGDASTALLGITIAVSLISLGVGVGAAIYANKQAELAREDMEKAIARLGKTNKQNDVASIPQLSGARNENADGKQAPIIIGRHLFAPYFLSEPYLEPSGADGEDLYWYGVLLAGQNGLWFEKIRNGTIDLIATGGLIPINNYEPQKGKMFFDPPASYNPNNPPPFYDSENFAEIVQKGNDGAVNSFTHSVFNEKWVDSLDSSVEIGRKKKDNAQVIDNKYVDDDGPDPIIRETARFPMRAEIEIFVDGLYGWDSNHGVATYASVEILVEWSKDQITWNPVSNSAWSGTGFNSGTLIRDVVKELTGKPYNEWPASSTTTVVPAHNGRYGSKTGLTKLTITATRAPGWIPVWSVNITLLFDDNSTQTLSASNTNDNSLASQLIVNEGSAVLTRNSTRQMRFIISIDFPDNIFTKDGSPVFIRAQRFTRMHTGGYRDRVSLSAIRTKQYNPKKSSNALLVAAKNLHERLEDKFCRIGIKLKVNKNTQENLDRFNIIASMTGRAWDSNLEKWSTVKTKTSNPAAIALEILTGLIHHPSRHEDKEIDLPSFGKLYEYCLNRQIMVEGESSPQVFNLESNGVLSSAARKSDALKSVLATCDAGLYINEFGKIITYYDHYQTTPIALLNPQTVLKMSDERSMNRKADGYKVEFIDQDADWSINSYRILRPRVEEDPLNTYAPIKLDLTTSYLQAMWHSRRMMAKEEFRPGVLKTTVGKEGRWYKPGSLIKAQDEKLKLGLGSGEIIEVLKEGNFITGFRTMEKFDISSDRDYFIEYYIVDNERNRVVYPMPVPGMEHRALKLQSAGEYTDKLMLSIPLPADEFYTPEMFNPLSVIPGAGISGRVYESKRYLVSDLSENSQGYDLSLVEYNEEIYNTTEINEIPQRFSPIISPPPKVFSPPETRAYDGVGGRRGDDGSFSYLETANGVNMGNGNHKERGVFIPSFIEAKSKRIIGDEVSDRNCYWTVEETEDNINWYNLVNDTTERSSLDIEPGRVSSMQAGKSTRGWNSMQGAFFFDPAVGYYVRKFTESQPNMSLNSQWFDIGDDEIWVFEFTWECVTPRLPDGIYTGLTRETNNYCQASAYSVSTGLWGAWGANSNNVYHRTAFNAKGRIFTAITYICGRDVQISQLPRPAAQYLENNQQANISAIKMSPDYPKSRFRLRTGANAMAAGSAFEFRLRKPMLYRDNPPVAVRIRTYEDQDKTILISDRIVNIVWDGGSGAVSETRFYRSENKPATPNGEIPTNWSLDVPAGDLPVWVSAVSKDGYGRQIGNWSAPIRQTGLDGEDGKDGLGVDAIPRGAIAYWSCDDLPLIPDDPSPANQKYRNDPQWSGWGMGGTGTMDRVNGVLILSGANYAAVSPKGSPGNIIVLRVRQPSGTLGDLRSDVVNSGGNWKRTLFYGVLSRDWQVFYSVLESDDYGITNIHYSTYAGGGNVLEISDLYIGSAAYLTPLIDNSGNGRHIPLAAGGIIPAPGKFGYGIQFLNRNHAKVSGVLDGHTGDFAVSVWADKFKNIFGKRGGSYSMGFGMEGRPYFLSNNPNASVYAGTIPVEDGKMHHLVLQVKNKVLYFYFDGQLNGQNSVAAHYNSPLCNEPFVIGNVYQYDNNQSAPAGTILDEIAVFNRALTGDEITALFKTTLEKKFSGIVNTPEERFLMATAFADVNNTGIIEGRRIQPGNFVYYAGTQGQWDTGYVYQWTGTSWIKKPKPSSGDVSAGWMYMAAANSIGEGMPVGLFSDVFCQALSAETAFIINLFARWLTILAGGGIRSDVLINGERTFEVNGDTGLLKAVNGIFKSGTFDSINILGASTFQGLLNGAGGTFSGNLNAAGGSYKGSLTAANVTVTGQHTADSAATTGSNPYIISSDNRLVDTTNTYFVNNDWQLIKKIRIVGKGSYRVRLNIRGRYSVEGRYNSGTKIPIINSTYRSIEGEEWSGIINATEDMMIIELHGTTYEQVGLTYAFKNTIFEVRCSNEPGLYKLLSHPIF